MADIYRATTNPGGSTPLGGANAEAFGGAIARGIEDVGQATRQIGERQLARDRDAQNAAAGLDLAQASADLDHAELEGRDKAGPGAAGHTEAMRKLADEKANAALGKIRDPELRRAYAVRYKNLAGNTSFRAESFERAEHTTFMVSNVRETTRVLKNKQMLNPDAMALEEDHAAIDTLWDGMDVADSIKVKGKKEDKREVTYAYATTMAERDPDKFLGTSDPQKRGGILKIVSAFLEPEDVERLRNQGQAEAARLEAQTNRAAAVWEAKRRDDIAAIGKRVTTLADYSVPDEDFDAAAADAAKMGDKTLALDIANWRDLRDVAKATRGFAPADWKKAVGELEAKGDKRSPGESMRLEHLRQLRGPSEARFNNAPDEWGNNNGDPSPAIDWDNPSPAQGAARAAWSKRIVGQGGKPALLNAAELNAFRQRAGAGLAGQIEVAQAMRSMFGIADGKLALQQVDRGNPNLAIMVGLPANTAKDYALGVEAVGRNPKLNRKDLANGYFSTLGGAIPAGELRGALFTAARSIAAAELDRANVAEPDDDEYAAAFQRGVQRAAGATGSAGGIVRWHADPIWIPPDMEKAEALARLSRAGPEQLLGATVSSSAPHYLASDGKLTRYDAGAVNRFLKGGANLRSVAPGLFELELEDGGRVMAKDGKPWQFDIRKIK